LTAFALTALFPQIEDKPTRNRDENALDFVEFQYIAPLCSNKPYGLSRQKKLERREKIQIRSFDNEKSGYAEVSLFSEKKERK